MNINGHTYAASQINGKGLSSHAHVFRTAFQRAPIASLSSGRRPPSVRHVGSAPVSQTAVRHDGNSQRYSVLKRADWLFMWNRRSNTDNAPNLCKFPLLHHDSAIRAIRLVHAILSCSIPHSLLSTRFQTNRSVNIPFPTLVAVRSHISTRAGRYFKKGRTLSIPVSHLIFGDIRVNIPSS